jgi:hypothetical protein
MPLQRLLGLVISWWGEDILAKGSLVASFLTAALFDGEKPNAAAPAAPRPPNRWNSIVLLKSITLVVFLLTFCT